METTRKLTPRMQELLTKLRGGYESESTDSDGVKWGNVYVANYVGNRSEAAVLAALTKAGLYRKYDGGDSMYEDVWGDVRLAEGA